MNAKLCPSDTPELLLQRPKLTEIPAVNDALWQIAGQIRNKAVSFFFGAGMSSAAPSTIPTGAALGSEIVTRLFPQRVDKENAMRLASAFPLEVLAEALAQDNIQLRTGLDELLTKQVAVAEFDTPDAHKALAGLAPYLTRIYTTNFDKLIERAFGDGCISVADSNDLPRVADAERREVPAILHVHGVEPGPYLITESDLLAIELRFFQVPKQ